MPTQGIGTAAKQWRVASVDSDNAQSDSTDNTSFSAPAVATTDPFTPSTRIPGYFELESYRNGFGGGVGLNMAIFLPIGTDAANETAECQCFGVSKWWNESRWVHLPLWHIDYTLGSLATGGTGEFFADSIAFSKNLCGATVFTNGSGDDFENVASYLSFDTMGFVGLYFDFKTGGSTAANNGLVKEL